MLARVEAWEEPAALARRLGPFGFQWLCACAIFPVQRFPLTVHLGAVLAAIVGRPAPDADEQRALYQLPWFRRGRIPQALRGELVAAIDPDLAGRLRAEIEDLLRSWSAPRAAPPTDRALRMFGGGAGLGADVDLAGDADDAILAAFVLGYPPPRRGMAVGAWLGRLLGLRTRVGDLALAAAVVAASLAAALAVAFWIVQPEWFQAPKQVVTQERRALPTQPATTPAPPAMPPAGSEKPKSVVGGTEGSGPASSPVELPPATTNSGWKLLAAGESPRAFEVFRDCPDCLDMVALPGGTFTMGSPKDEPGRYDDEDQVSVTLPAFAISRFPVTRGQYAAFLAATGRATTAGCYTGAVNDKGEQTMDPQASWRDPKFAQDDSHPVVCVNWDDASAYAAWMKQRTGHDYRLLSEAEYEYANRAGTETAYFWGPDANAGCAFANMADVKAKRANSGWTTVSCDDGYLYTSPVGHFTANPWGLYDTTGNVWSWTADCYADSNATNSRNGAANSTEDCSRRVVRGGSWYDGPRDLRSASRGRSTATYRYFIIGFRLARTLSPPSP